MEAVILGNVHVLIEILLAANKHKWAAEIQVQDQEPAC